MAEDSVGEAALGTATSGGEPSDAIKARAEAALASADEAVVPATLPIEPGDTPPEVVPLATGRLTTHVLDLALGRPGAGLGVELWRIDGAERTLIGRGTTNEDGRFDQPLLEGAAFEIGHYELVFAAGDYLRAHHNDLPDPPFLDLVPIRFGIAEATAHYHVPLLLSPFGYSTYRGS